MPISREKQMLRLILGGAALTALAACDPAGGFDADLRHIERRQPRHLGGGARA